MKTTLYIFRPSVFEKLKKRGEVKKVIRFGIVNKITEIIIIGTTVIELKSKY